jgi:phosphoadenosine phosphosulfate reductase
MSLENKVLEYQEKTKDFSPEEIIKFAYQEFKDKLVFATSLGEEDQVLTDMISKIAPETRIFTLDTGRLFQESYDLLEKTQKRYSMKIEIYCPNTQAVEEMVANKGINLFYESVENRKTCCGVRKIEPLKRALKSSDVWMVGLRSSQSVTRTELEAFQWDEGNQKIKISPLASWSLKDLKEYIKENNVDVNPLHEQGFVSIGCAPCTRAIKENEDVRAGRWWWENPESKECGLHNNPNQKKFTQEKKEQ